MSVYLKHDETGNVVGFRETNVVPDGYTSGYTPISEKEFKETYDTVVKEHIAGIAAAEEAEAAEAEAALMDAVAAFVKAVNSGSLTDDVARAFLGV